MARRSAWETIRSLKALGKTIVLTTHYLDEAQQLADRVAVLREGRIVRLGTPVELTGGTVSVEIRYRRGGEEVVLETDEPTRALHELTAAAVASGIELEGPRCGGRRWRTSTWSSSGRTRSEAVPPQLRAEQVLFWRNREAAFFIFVFPLMLYLLLGALYGAEIDGIPSSDVLLAGLLGYGAANTSFGGLAILLVVRREAGILKRLRSTPLPAWAYLGASLVSILIVFAVQTIALFALGWAAYGASGPGTSSRSCSPCCSARPASRGSGSPPRR